MLKNLVLLLLWPSVVFADNIEGLFNQHATKAKIVYFFTGIPPSIQLAQAFNETGIGSSIAGPIVNECNNVFAIRYYPGQGWTIYGLALDAYKTKKFKWRKYPSKLISWLDYAVFMLIHGKRNLWRSWRHWIDNPVKYGGRGYWQRVERTILKYKLYKYDNLL